MVVKYPIYKYNYVTTHTLIICSNYLLSNFYGGLSNAHAYAFVPDL